MNCLIVDALTEGRAEALGDYLKAQGHNVVLHQDQLQVLPGGRIPSPAWIELVRNQNVVFLHVGEEQRNAPAFFVHAAAELPVLCYTGSEAPESIAAACSAPGLRVLCPDPVGRGPEHGERLVAIAARWVGPIVGRSDRDRFNEAWYNVRNLDVAKEESLAALEKQLAAALKRHGWAPEKPLSDELRTELDSVKQQRTEWGL